MKKIEEYMQMFYDVNIIEDKVEGGFVIEHPELPGCITEGETLKQAFENLEDAKRVWLEAAIEDGIDIPLPHELDNYSGQFKIRMPKSLHKSLAEQSKKEGISMNQYCVYLLAKNDALYEKK